MSLPNISENPEYIKLVKDLEDLWNLEEEKGLVIDDAIEMINDISIDAEALEYVRNNSDLFSNDTIDKIIYNSFKKVFTRKTFRKIILRTRHPSALKCFHWRLRRDLV